MGILVEIGKDKKASMYTAVELNAFFASPTFGGTTNNVRIEPDGTLVMNGEATVFDDMLGALIGNRLENPSSRVSQDVAEGTVVFNTNATTADYVVINTQFSHSMKLGSNVYPHLHWFQAQDKTPNWLIQYRWQRNGQAKTTAWTNLKMTTNVFTYVSGTLNQISMSAAIVPPTGYSISDILQCRIVRDTTNVSTLFAADPYTANVHAMNFDIHYEVDTIGSRTEYTK